MPCGGPRFNGIGKEEVRARTIKPNQSSAALDLRSKPTSEKGARDAILRAEATVGGAKYVIYSQPFPLTVK